MKKLLILSFLALGYQSASAQLMLKYDFNGNALDQSGRNNNGILWGGATYGMDRFGNSNSALAVNTENGVISQSNIGITGNNSFTMSIWIKPTDDPTWPNGQIMHLGDEGPVAASGSPPMRNARVRAMASLGMARRASLGPTKVNPLRLIVLGDAIR